MEMNKQENKCKKINAKRRKIKRMIKEAEFYVNRTNSQKE